METWTLFRSSRSLGEGFKIPIWMKVSEKKLDSIREIAGHAWVGDHFEHIFRKKQFSCIRQSFAMAYFVVVLGFLLDKKVGINQPKRIENARILIANTPMDADKIKVCLICLIFCHHYLLIIIIVRSLQSFYAVMIAVIRWQFDNY